MGKPFDFDWSGMLTQHNVEEVAALLLQLLTGTGYVFTEVSEWHEFKPTVLLQQLSDDVDQPIKVGPGHSRGSRAIRLYQTKGEIMFETKLQFDMFDPDYHNPHFDFRRTDQLTTLTISHRRDGRLQYRVFSVVH